MRMPSKMKDIRHPNLLTKYWTRETVRKDNPNPEVNIPKAMPLLLTNQWGNTAALTGYPIKAVPIATTRPSKR